MIVFYNVVCSIRTSFLKPLSYSAREFLCGFRSQEFFSYFYYLLCSNASFMSTINSVLLGMIKIYVIKPL